jgi:hypothetical protein
MKGSFNDRVRQALDKHFKVEEIFTTVQAAAALELSTPERRRLWSALHDLTKYGEYEALGQGRWRRLGREERPELKEIMWRLLRIHLVMTVEKMCLQSGAAPKTTAEFFETCMRQGLVINEEKRRGKPGRYRLVTDTGPAPPATPEKAEKLRRLRRQKKQEILGMIDGIFGVVADLRLAVSQWEEG